MSVRPTPPVNGKAGDRARAALKAELARTQAELRDLRRQLGNLRSTVGADLGTTLREANEQLVLAALRADAIASEAETAARTFSPDAARAADDAREGLLRDANEALVIAALHAHTHEEDAEIAHRRQLRYLAVVAHELRSPLSPIRTTASMLDRLAGDAGKLAQAQAVITRQVAHMSRLVEDLLDAARVDAVDFRVDIEPVDLGVALQQAMQVIRTLVDERQQSLRIDLPPGPLIVAGDAIRLVQVFNNLLENASKYTPVGGEIRIRAVRHPQAIAVHVADNGIGISAAALPRVFDLFVQESARPDQRGLGIGLAVVRGLVNALGGSIVATSAGPGCGSEFIVTLPVSDSKTT
jgi:signal transduction histidine kinase